MSDVTVTPIAQLGDVNVKKRNGCVTASVISLWLVVVNELALSVIRNTVEISKL